MTSRTKLDNRIRVLVENGIILKHRSMFVIVGNKARDQVPILHHILTKATVSSHPTVLWCYKKELGFNARRKSKMKKIKTKSDHGNANINENDPFEMFVASTNIRYCYYSESHKILGNTYGMLVLQDFEAITPNLLARTIETVEGGGLVVLLLSSVNSLRQLFTMTMDVHSRYRTEGNVDIVPRFNERFILSLSSCKSCLVTDDSLNVLPISSHINNLKDVEEKCNKKDKELESLKESMEDTKPIGELLKKCRTKCQAKVLLRLLDVITEKSAKATCSITAARGRGKSASLGLAIAGAIGFGYTNIFVTSPSPENLKTLFEFIVKGFDQMEYEEHTDYELIQSNNPEFNKALVRINVFREHRQTIQYIHPSDAVKLGQAELVVIDEAAAIPLPMVKTLIDGPYIVFLASTINGYEGTGRSLSLKLLSQLRQDAFGSIKSETGDIKLSTANVRKLYELSLDESIRYKPGDQVELWLNKVLCLDSTNSQNLIGGTPSPSKCELYYVNRDTLFSYHKASEVFLNNMMAIYVSAHYKNTPNDLQMLSDAPAHHIFVLMAPVKDDQTKMPDILAVIQVCYEGNLSKDTVSGALGRGKRAAGDLIPWTISQQFLDYDFPQLLGARIVRIAVHPDYQSMGYGQRAIELLTEYYEGKFPLINKIEKKIKNVVSNEETLTLLEENVAPRDNLPPLLLKLNERQAEKLDYLGVSYGLTLSLLRFWKRNCFVPVYLRQTTNDLTGEHTNIALKCLNDEGKSLPSWLIRYWKEFKYRFISLLGYEFKKFSPHMSLSLLQPVKTLGDGNDDVHIYNRTEISLFLSNTDMKRLHEYARNMVDNHLVTDLIPTVAKLYFNGHLGNKIDLSVIQSAIIIGVGLQFKNIEDVSKELNVPVNQLLALYSKTIRKISDYLDQLCLDTLEEQIIKKNSSITDKVVGDMKSKLDTLEEDLSKAADEIKLRQEKDKNNMRKELSEQFSKYAIQGDDEEWDNALSQVNIKNKSNGIIQVKTDRPEKLSQKQILKFGSKNEPPKKKKKLNKK
uniref:RNA cytidine acetyltransferase n=1 Tax=Parastrongyloides trichosuri TaxID=131310 RepID=A0A0N4ZF12_PARTI